jgi:hypothetical protein
LVSETQFIQTPEAFNIPLCSISRVKDFYDIWVYSRNVDFEGEILARSLAATFARRQTLLPTELEADIQWQTFVRRTESQRCPVVLPK